MKIPKIVIIAPTLNEEGTIKAFITELLKQTRKHTTYQWHILIVDSHSTDKTEKIVLGMRKKYGRKVTLLSAPRGLGKSLYRGFDYALLKLHGDFALTLEADLSNDPKQFPRFLKELSQSDLVVGSRYIKGGRIKHWSRWRKLLSATANVGLRILIGGPIHEYTNLYRAVRLSRWKQMRKRLKSCEGWLFVPALAFEAIRLNLRISEVPIIYADRRAGSSKMDTPSYTKNLLFYALRFRMNRHGTFS